MNWLRKAQVLVAGMSIEPPLEIHFQVDFDNKPEPNTAEIKLHNLSDDTIARIKRGQNIILNAGYEGDVGTIFAGNITKVVTDWEGVDKITRIMAGDGVDAWLNATVSKTYRPGIRASQIIRDIIGGFGLEIGEIRLTEDVVYSSGRTVHGKLRQVLQGIVNDCKSKMTITNGVILIRQPAEGTQTGFLLNSDTGLIGTPGYIDSDDADFDVECLLNHRITADSLIRIESRTARGNFRVVKGRHSGDDQSWTTQMEVVAI